MAGLDTSIALGIKPVDFGDPNEGRMNALRAQMMQMQMQQGQFNMMKAQRDMQYQDQQRAQAAAAVARDKAAEKEAINAFLKTAQPGSAFNPNPNTPYAPDDASAEGSGMFPGWNNAQPPDMNATIQQLRDRGRFEAAKKMMGPNQAFNVNESSNVKLGEEKTKAEAAKIDSAMKTIAYHVTQIPAVTPENYAAWRASVVKDIPGYDSVLAKEAPTDPNQFSQMMGQYQQLGTKMVADHYASVAQGENTKIIGIRPGSREAYDVAGSEGKSKTTEKLSDVGTLIKERAALDKNAPDYQEVLSIYNDRIEKANNIKAGGGGAQSDIGKLLADRAALDKADPEYDIKSRAYTRKIEELTGGKAKDIGTADAAIAAAEQNIKDIDKILNHKALKSNTGIGAWNPKQFVPGTDSKDFNLRLAQVQGEAFLSAFNILKGGGAITEIEGVKATRAINRMNNALSKDDFIEASNEAKEILERGIKQANDRKARNTWGGTSNAPATNAPAAAAPAAGGKVINFEDLK